MPEYARHWMRHTAIVPKGFLRYHVLESLGEKPMSGSEIMNEIERRTNGRWKPSPGSIYPLLAWLQDSGYVKELPTDQDGLKRYQLTQNGRKLLEEQRKIGMRFRKEAKLFAPPFLGALWFRIPPEKTAEVRETMRRVMSAFFELGGSLEEKFSEKALEQACKVLDETAEKLEDINRKLRGSRDE
nr:PadR family transcriptional regulator [Candidatus Njordarchaeum guaymaensis]